MTLEAHKRQGQCGGRIHRIVPCFYFNQQIEEETLDLQYCNGQKRYDFSTDKERLREQVGAGTFKDRNAFYDIWRHAPCCADDCEQYRGECSNGGIKFKSVPAYGLEPAIRRFIIKHDRYKTASELMRENNEKRTKQRSAPILLGVRDGKSDHDAIRIGGQGGDGLSGQSEEVPSDQAERIEEMLSLN